AVVTSTETLVNKAQAEAEKLLGKAGDSDEEDQPVQRPQPSPVVDEDELYELETVAKKAKKAGGTSPQVKSFIQAAREDELGTYAVGLMDRIMAASTDTLKAIDGAMEMATALDAEILIARGGDTEQKLRKLEDAARRLNTMFHEAKNLSTATQEAAAKCEVEKAATLMEQTKQRATVASGQADAVMDGAKTFAEGAEQQVAALRKGKGMVADATSLAEEAFAAFSSFQQLIADAAEEESAAQEAAEAKKRKEEAEKRLAEEQKAEEERRQDRERREAEEKRDAEEKQKSDERAREALEKQAQEEEIRAEERRRKEEEDRMAAEAEANTEKKAAEKRVRLSVATGEDDGDEAVAPSAPARGKMRANRSKSVMNMLEQVGAPNSSVSPVHKRKSTAQSTGLSAITTTDQKTGGRSASSRMFNRAMSGGRLQ
ncbi:unnamed protein product, partial [Sphacelaria rigidula]